MKREADREQENLGEQQNLETLLSSGVHRPSGMIFFAPSQLPVLAQSSSITALIRAGTLGHGCSCRGWKEMQAQ